jgi:hypothetical protein
MIGTLPRVVERVRSNPKLAVAIAVGIVLLLAWIGWAIVVTSDHGSRAGLGVLIAWPALIVAVALVSLPVIGGYRLIRGLSASDEHGGSAGATVEEERDGDEDEPASGSEAEASAKS